MKVIRFKTQKEKNTRRHLRVRAKVSGTAEKPRLSVFRSNKHTFIQLIDDEARLTLVSAGDTELKAKKGKDGFSKIFQAEAVGKLLAEKAVAKKITKAVFDRGGYRFTGRVKAVADGAREGGLTI